MESREKFDPSAVLRKKISEQLDRLFTQLADLDEFKAEFDSEAEWQQEYDETKHDLQAFEEFLSRSIKGDMSLMDEFSQARLAIQMAIAQAFKTPEVIRLFAQHEPKALRDRLAVVQRERRTKHLGEAEFVQLAVEILTALQKLGDKLSQQEETFLQQNSVSATLARTGDQTSVSLGALAQQSVMSAAESAIQQRGDDDE